MWPIQLSSFILPLVGILCKGRQQADLQFCSTCSFASRGVVVLYNSRALNPIWTVCTSLDLTTNQHTHISLEQHPCAWSFPLCVFCCLQNSDVRIWLCKWWRRNEIKQRLFLFLSFSVPARKKKKRCRFLPPLSLWQPLHKKRFVLEKEEEDFPFHPHSALFKLIHLFLFLLLWLMRHFRGRERKKTCFSSSWI